MRVTLLPTGKAELLGFQMALKRLFPGHEFHTIANNDDEQRPFDGFTSAPLPIHPSTAPTNLDKIIEQAASELVPGRLLPSVPPLCHMVRHPGRNNSCDSCHFSF